MWAGMLLAAAAVAFLPATQAAAQAVQTSEKAFDIPAQPLADAIILFGQQSGIQVTAGGGILSGKTSAPVSGRLAAAEALSRMLAGTGLTFRYIGARAVELQPAPSVADGAVQLGPVRVEGSGSGGAGGYASVSSDPGATEGTNSYTTRSMDTAAGLRLSARETPQSVSVVTRQQLDDQVIVDLHDAISNIPGLTSVKGDYSGNSATFLARGFSFTTLLIDGLPIGIDGSGSYNGATDDMAIYDRIEVLRGADGLLIGSGTPSAAVNFVRKRPTADPQVLLTASAGSWNNYRVEADVSGPLNNSGSVRGRMLAVYGDSDSFVDYVNSKTKLAYGVVEADLGPGTTLMVGGSWRDVDGRGTWPGMPSAADGSALDLPRNTYLGTDYSYEDTSHYSLFGELRQDLGGDWQVKLSGQIQNMDADFIETYIWRASDGSLRTAPAGYSYIQRRASAEIRANGSFTLFGRVHQLVLGANWQRHHRDGDGGWDPDTWSDTGGVALDPFDWNPHQELTYIDRSLWQWGATTTQTGLYANMKLNPTDRLSLLLGSRLSFYKEKDGFEKNWILTPYLGATWAFDGHHSLYASYTQIFEPQSTEDKDENLLPPVTGTNYEAGIKGEYLDGLLNVSLAAFLMRQTNRPVDDLDSTNPCRPGSTGWCKRAGGLVESKGVELEVAGSPVPGWNISASYDFVIAKYVKDDDASLVGQRYDVSMPKHQIKLSTNYDFSGALEGWSLGGSLRYQSWTGRGGTWGPSYTYLEGQDPYVLVGLRAGYRIDEKWQVAINVDNVLDKTYFSGLGWGDSGGRLYGEPRSFQVTLRGKL